MAHKEIYGKDLDYERWLVDVGKLLGHEPDSKWNGQKLYEDGYLRQEAADAYRGWHRSQVR